MRVSIVTPTLNEERNVAARALELRRQSAPWEWIVSDGGSSDRTVALAARCGAVIVAAKRGRGAQLGAGAAAASGDIFLFLHADTALPDGALDAVRAALGKSEVVGGNFALRFDEPGTAAVLFAFVYHLQQRLMRTYFGDSAIFVRRSVYERLGGFPDVAILEDDAFVRRLERAGRTVRIPLAVTTSARRYRGRPLRTLLRWTVILLLHRLGIPAQRLAQLYAPHRDEP